MVSLFAANFMCVEGARDNLLSYRSSVDLGLVRLTYSVKAEDDELKQQLKTKYPNCFSGKIGTLKGFELVAH